MKKLLSFLLSVMLILSVVPMGLFSITASAATATSGTTGNCTWTLDGTHLTISGNGKMEDYSYSSTLPWGTDITSVTIEQGVTNIGYFTFGNCGKLTSVSIPDSVTSIDGYAFYDCTGLTSVTIPDSVTEIGSYAFFNTAYYKNDDNWTNGVLYIGNHLIDAKQDIVNGDYTIRQGTKCIADDAFKNCTGLTSITIPDGVTSILRLYKSYKRNHTRQCNKHRRLCILWLHRAYKCNHRQQCNKHRRFCIW